MWIRSETRRWHDNNIPANIRLGEDVLKTSWRRLEDLIEDIIARRLANMSWRRLGRCLQDILGRRIANTSWRRLEDVLENKKCLLGYSLIWLSSIFSGLKWFILIHYEKNYSIILKWRIYNSLKKVPKDIVFRVIQMISGDFR